MFTVFATGVWLTLKISLRPFLEKLSPVLKDVIELLKGLVQGGAANSSTVTEQASSVLVADFEAFLAYINGNVNSIALAGLICVLIAYLYRFFAGISDSTTMILVNGHMSSLTHGKYLGAMFENLRKIVVYQLIDAVLSIVYYALVFVLEYLLLRYVAQYAAVPVVFFGVCAFFFAATLYATCMSQVMTNMLVGGMGLKEAFAKGLFPKKQYFWKMFAAYLSVIIICVYLSISTAVFTFGVGTVMVLSFFTVMKVCMKLVDYYIINVKKYFIDYDNIVIPKELRENDEQLLNKVDI